MQGQEEGRVGTWQRYVLKRAILPRVSALAMAFRSMAPVFRFIHFHPHVVVQAGVRRFDAGMRVG